MVAKLRLCASRTMGLGYVYTEDLVIVYNEHVQNLGVCQTTTSSSMKLAACLGQGSHCKALTHLFSRFYYGHPCTFCRVVARGLYLINCCNYLHEAKAVVEVFDRIIYKHTQSASSIKPMKLVKHKVMPFQVIKLTCTSKLEV